MNYEITYALNQLTGTSSFFDAIVFIFAEIVPWFIVCLFLILVIFSYKRTVSPLITSIIAFFVAGVGNSILKIVFNEKRPFEIYKTIEPIFLTYGFGSFPSSHAIFFATLATLSFFFVRPFAYFFLIMSIFISVARVIAGVHFFFDIIVGWILGFFIAYFSYHIFRNIMGYTD